MRQAFMGYLFVCLCMLNPIVAFHNAEANAADGRYRLEEFSMDGCPACVAALKDVRELTEAGVDVQCYNTSRNMGAAAYCRKNYLSLRPAWRLTRTSDGAEVGRWYGANKAGIIIATIQAKFPAPSAPIETEPEEEINLAEEKEESTLESEEPLAKSEKGESLRQPLPGSDEDAPTLPEPSKPDEKEEPQTSLAEMDAEFGAQSEDFRDRPPVVEKFTDVSFLDKSLDEWDSRNDDDEEEEEPTPKPELDDDLFAPSVPKEGESNDARLGDRLTDRAADRILEGVLCKIDDVKKDAFKKFDDIGNRATDQLERRVEKEFEGVKALIEKRIDEALADAKNLIRQELFGLGKTVFKTIAIIAFACFAVYVLWKASGLADRVAKKEISK